MFASSRRARWFAGLVVLAVGGGCQPEVRLAPVDLPSEPPPQVAPFAFLITVDMVEGTVKVAPPAAAPHARLTFDTISTTAHSLAGGEIVEVRTANLIRSGIVANKRTVAFDLTLSNKLSVSDLVTPTFPVLPSGTQGILAFPYTIAVSGTQGGKATADTTWNGDGTAGSGTPINFFNDFDDCANNANADCYRWILFPSPLKAGATSSSRRVGFTVDKNVSTVTVYLVVAADLLDHPPIVPPGGGVLLGTVTSPGNVTAGAIVTLNPGNHQSTVDANGNYLFTALPAGSYAATLSGLPPGCVAPVPLTAVITDGVTTSVHHIVTCATGAQLGGVAGNATAAGMGSLAGYDIALISGTGTTHVTAGANGDFSFVSVPPGSYVVEIEGLTQTCTGIRSPAIAVAAGQTTNVNVAATCPLSTILSGLVTRNGEPTDGITITVTIGSQSFSTTTGGAGTYHFGPEIIPPGTFLVAASVLVSGFPDNCSGPAPQTVALQPTNSLDLPVMITCGTGSGSIVGSASSPHYLGGLPYARVELRNAPGDLIAIDTTGLFGGFQFTGLAPGEYALVVADLAVPCPNKSQAVNISVAGGPAAIVEIPVDCGPPVTGGEGLIYGVVVSPTRGALNGLTLRPLVNGADLANVTTGGSGNFAISLSWVGNTSATVEISIVSGLPEGCVPPVRGSVVVAENGRAYQDILIDCTKK